jgi:hypothetical protein
MIRRLFNLADHMSEPWTRIGRLAAASLMFAAGCQAPECVVQTTQYTTTANAIGYLGPTEGKPVARFDLTQDFITHTPYAACAQGPLQDVGVVRATVTNIAGAPLAIKFDVQGMGKSGNMVWSHVDSIGRIMPNETLDLGEVGVSPVRLDIGARVVVTALAILPE